MINVSSQSGKVPVPMLAPYSAAKHAVMAFSAALRMEWSAQWGIEVTTCLPSFHRTPLLANSDARLEAVWRALPKHTQDAYGEACKASVGMVLKQTLFDWAWDARRVVEGLSDAATSLRAPPAELAIGGDARYVLNTMRHLPPFIYEPLIYFGMCWDLIEPEQP